MQGAAEEVYLPDEIARAAGVPLEQVVVAVGGPRVFVGHRAAVRLGRQLAGLSAVSPASRSPLFSSFYCAPRLDSRLRVPLALAGSFETALLAAALAIASIGFVPADAAMPPQPAAAAEPVSLVFLATAGPGGGGGGGGLKQAAPVPEVQRRGPRDRGNPVAARPPAPIEEAWPPPLTAELFPVVVAPLAPGAADPRDRVGTLDATEVDVERHGPGQGGGAGVGAGGGLGKGDGSGIGQGAGGGIGGGVFRPGSGVEPPRLLREVKPDYPDSARRRGIEGEVVLELVVRRDGLPDDIRIRRRLGPEFDDRAVQAVRQWRFAPGRWRGTPVDVAVEVAVEFKLR